MSQHDPRSADPRSQRIDVGGGDRPLELELAANQLQLLTQLIVASVAGNAIVRQTIVDLLATSDPFMDRLAAIQQQQIQEMIDAAVTRALAEQRPQVVHRTEHVQTRFPISPLDLFIGMFLGLLADLGWLDTTQFLHIGVLNKMIVFVAMMLGIGAIAGVIGAFFRQHTVQLPNDDATTEKEAQQ